MHTPQRHAASPIRQQSLARRPREVVARHVRAVTRTGRAAATRGGAQLCRGNAQCDTSERMGRFQPARGPPAGAQALQVCSEAEASQFARPQESPSLRQGVSQFTGPRA